jgi:chromosome condensin MukBEF complex kleisin-like MukF subunit
MQELEKLGSSFDKVAMEARAMDERLHSLYEDMGHILNRYYEIADIPSDVMKERLAIKKK